MGDDERVHRPLTPRQGEIISRPALFRKAEGDGRDVGVLHARPDEGGGFLREHPGRVVAARLGGGDPPHRGEGSGSLQVREQVAHGFGEGGDQIRHGWFL